MKKITRPTFFATTILVGLIVLFSASAPVCARGTIEIYNDAGIFMSDPSEINNVPARERIWIWSADKKNPLKQGVNWDAHSTEDPNPPEGRTSFRLSVNSSAGAWGVDKIWLDANGKPILDKDGIEKPIAHDYSAFSNGHLRFWLKSSKQVTIAVESFDVEKGLKIEQKIDISPTIGTSLVKAKIIKTLPQVSVELVVAEGPHDWKEIIIPLNQFRSDFVMMDVVIPFSIKLETNPPGTCYVDSVRWTKPIVPPLLVFPDKPTLSPGQNRQFTIEGRSAQGEPIYLFGNFGAPGALGSVSPDLLSPARMGGVFSASALGEGSMRVQSVNSVGRTLSDKTLLVTHVPLTVTEPSPRDEYGLISETISGIELGETNKQDGDLLAYSENVNNPATLPILSSQSGLAPEGAVYMKTIFREKLDSSHYQGWVIHWGRSDVSEEESDTHTKDMSSYYDGSLQFWFRGPSQGNLKQVLRVGIRSGNVPANKELSHVKLEEHVQFNDTWQPVIIPLSVFAKPRPWADLFRMKILFNIYVEGSLGGSEEERTFSIDNLRWVTDNPGELSSLTIAPGSAHIPLGGRRSFVATGWDAQGLVRDVSPAWQLSHDFGTMTPIGNRVLLTANQTPQSGLLTADVGGILSQAEVQVAEVSYQQAFHVYSDINVGGPIGISTGPAEPTNTKMTLTERRGGAPEGQSYMQAKFTLDNFGDGPNAYAVWFSSEASGSRFLPHYNETTNSTLHFWVKTNHDLQISIRSANIDPGKELSKIRLSELGIPTDGEWERVLISLGDFKARDPRLDFDQISTYFSIGALSSQINEVVGAEFSVDEVKWMTDSPRFPSDRKIYNHLLVKQHDVTGLVRSYDTLDSAYTYDQALAAIAFTYQKDFDRAARIFDFFLDQFKAGAFAGFSDDWDVANGEVKDPKRSVGPNAWLLLALIHHKNSAPTSRYDDLMIGLAAWLLSNQTDDGGVSYGFAEDGTRRGEKSTEHNFDCYAAFTHYYRLTRNATYRTAAIRVLDWLENGPAWNSSEQRFNVGTEPDGRTPNTDKALDVYAWAPLALNRHAHLLDLIVDAFGTTKVSGRTDIPVTGFDMNVDKDAVWLEGTAHVALAYQWTNQPVLAQATLNELDKATEHLTDDTQGLTYATNIGTAYDFMMDATHPAVSAMTWTLFAKWGFNPFQIFPLFDIRIKDAHTHAPVPDGRLTWANPNPQTGWSLSNQYIQIHAQPITRTDNWFLTIYTDNANPQKTPHFVDPTPDDPNNHDSNPAGILYAGRWPLPGEDPNDPRNTPPATTSWRLPLSWTVKPQPVVPDVDLKPSDPDTGPKTETPDTRFQWFYVKDLNTPDLDLNSDGEVDVSAFRSDEDYIRIRDARGLHLIQGPAEGEPPGSDFFRTLTPDAYLYLQANFQQAAARSVYKTGVILEFTWE